MLSLKINFIEMTLIKSGFIQKLLLVLLWDKLVEEMENLYPNSHFVIIKE